MINRICCATLILLLATACGDRPSGNLSPAVNAAGGGGVNSMEKIRASGAITFGVKYDTPPFGFIAEGRTEPEGFEIDLVTEIARRMGVTPKFVAVNATNRVANLDSGKIDVIAATMIATRTREKQVDFSAVYFEDDQRLLVRSGSDITGVGQLDGKTVALVQGSTEETVLRKVAPGAKILTFQSWPNALQALLRGDADALSTTVGILSGLKQTADQSGSAVQIVAPGIAQGPTAMAVKQGDSALRDELNAALMSMADDGTYQRIYQKWWSGVLPEPLRIAVIPMGS
ncbi:transporter substrate-binding domain-containing protein [Saccharopolyspora sp. K220]|uniref:transporter substrate-binding domain-containing protein n=1 Tax=Saccharopolyspora soli TaxID=2926618 RepID=UPI001F59F84D|nr:transporter substrate-binding domain-containing protein [Saccharopolyspora soli]MCI2421669.1 transporter substrate-binding domain-containing protein [Saccharopolyspora soli]